MVHGAIKRLQLIVTILISQHLGDYQVSAPESKKQQTDFKSALWPFIINTIVETAQGGGARLGQGPMHLEALGDGGAGEAENV